MPDIDATEFARLLADRHRLAALGLIAMEPRTAADVAQALSISERDAVRLVGRLTAAGLVRPDGLAYALDTECLRDFAASLTPVEPVDPAMLANLTVDEADVVARYFRGRRLLEIPVHAEKRRAVLRRLVQEFEPGRRYSERQVNMMLAMFHPDHASLRRFLVDGGLLDRDPHEAEYWRIGGPVDVTRPE